MVFKLDKQKHRNKKKRMSQNHLLTDGCQKALCIGEASDPEGFPVLRRCHIGNPKTVFLIAIQLLIFGQAQS